MLNSKSTKLYNTAYFIFLQTKGGLKSFSGGGGEKNHGLVN